MTHSYETPYTEARDENPHAQFAEPDVVEVTFDVESEEDTGTAGNATYVDTGVLDIDDSAEYGSNANNEPLVARQTPDQPPLAERQGGHPPGPPDDIPPPKPPSGDNPVPGDGDDEPRDEQEGTSPRDQPAAASQEIETPQEQGENSAPVPATPETPMIKLPKYSYLNAEDVDPDTLDIVSEWRETLGSRNQLPPSLPIDEQRHQQLDAMRQAAIKTGRELGLDLTERLPADEDIFFYPPEIVSTLIPSDEGVVKIDGEMIVAESPNTTDTLAFAGSLLWHRLGHNAVTLELAPVDDSLLVSIENTGREAGYARAAPGSTEGLTQFMMLDGIAAATLHQHTQDTYWPEEPALRDIGQQEMVLFPYPVALGHGMVGRMATATGKPTQEIWHDIWRGKLTGVTEGVMGMIRQTFGDHAIEILANYNSDSPEAMAKTARALGMNVTWHEYPEDYQEE